MIATIFRLALVSLLLQSAESQAVGTTPHAHDYFELRSGLKNSHLRFALAKQARVAFLGGSITSMEGWRGLTYKSLQKRFPHTEFDFVDAGIPSIDSTGDAFRLPRDVFGRGKVDLLFVEASVNDLHNGRRSTERIRAMEGIIRQARRLNPDIDIVFMCFVDVPFVEEIRAGRKPAVIADHLKVAEHYKIPSIDLATEVTERIGAGEFEWEKFRDCHPSPFGHALYHATIERLFDAAFAEPVAEGDRPAPHAMPAQPLDEKNYQRGRLVGLEQAQPGEGWKLDPRWKPAIRAGTRAGFVEVPMLVAEQPGATLKFKFEGTAVGVFVVAGPDTGNVEYSIDGGEKRELNCFTRWSGGLYLPWPFVLDADLAPGEHELALTTSAKRDPDSKGSATRIVKFLAN